MTWARAGGTSRPPARSREVCLMGSRGHLGYSQTHQPCLLWDTRESRHGKEMHFSRPMLNVGGIFKDVGVGKMEPASTSERQPQMCTMSPFILCEANKSRPPEQRTTRLVCRFCRRRFQVEPCAYLCKCV